GHPNPGQRAVGQPLAGVRVAALVAHDTVDGDAVAAAGPYDHVAVVRVHPDVLHRAGDVSVGRCGRVPVVGEVHADAAARRGHGGEGDDRHAADLHGELLQVGSRRTL